MVVVERAAEVGGYARAERRGQYTFDPSISELPRGVDDELRDGLLRHLGADGCTLEPPELLYRAAFPDLSIDVPFGLTGVASAYAERFPRERAGIERFLALCEQLLADAHQLPIQLSLADLDAAAARFPAFFRHGGSTLAEVLDEHFSDARLKAALAVSWPKAGLPPSRLSFTTFAQGLALQAKGTLQCRGGRLAHALADGLGEAGGQVLLECEAVRIPVQNGRVVGVTLADGQSIAARVVVSNAPAPETLERLVGLELLPGRFVRRLRRMRTSSSCFVLFAATRLDLRELGAASETFLGAWDGERAFAAASDGRPAGRWASVPTLLDSTVAPAGEHLVVLRALAPYDRPWVQERAAWVEQLLDELEALYPGFRLSLTLVESLTPAELALRGGNANGAAFGWENTPAQTGGRRLGLAVPVEGLYLAGQWTQPGHGAYRALLSGMHVARAILAADGAPDAIPDFRRAPTP